MTKDQSAPMMVVKFAILTRQFGRGIGRPARRKRVGGSTCSWIANRLCFPHHAPLMGEH
jgi:hypothetical protein